MDTIKPGYQTTEFWLMGLAQVVGLLSSMGFLDSAQGSDFVNAVKQVVGGVIAIVAFVQYMRSRTSLKVSAVQAIGNANK